MREGGEQDLGDELLAPRCVASRTAILVEKEVWAVATRARLAASSSKAWEGVLPRSSASYWATSTKSIAARTEAPMRRSACSRVM